MSRSLVILCLAVVPAFALWEPNYKVKYDVNPFSRGKSSYMPMPQNMDDAVAKGWVEKAQPEGMAGYELLTMMCPPEAKDHPLCLLYDDTGYIAGQQVALVADNVSENTYDLFAAGYKIWEDTVNGVTTKYYTLTHYYLTPEELAVPAATRLAERNNKFIVQKNFVLPGYNGTTLIISATDTKKLTSSGFTKQGCFPGMGTHYYFNMTKSMECTDANSFPYFVLEYNNQIIGLGWSLSAKYPLPEGGLDPFERPPKLAIKLIVPRGPECLYNNGDFPGILTLHSYFIADGHKINCMW